MRRSVSRSSLDLGWLGLAGLLAWLGSWFHDFREFAGTAGLTPNTVADGVIVLGLIVLVWRAPGARLPCALLLAYSLMSTVGGALSVLPLPIWPWVPDQNLGHYVTHAIAFGLEVPLVILSVRRLNGSFGPGSRLAG
jgi:hypothetical protein